MANQSKAKGAEALQKAGIARRSFSIQEFCARNGISEGLYRTLRKKKIGPAETRIRDRVVVTDDDETEWLKARKIKADTTTIEPA